MKQALLMLVIFSGVMAGCATQAQLKRPSGWDKAKGQAAIDARKGIYKSSLQRMMNLGQYMFNTEGFLFLRRDDDAKVIATDPWVEAGSEYPNTITVEFSQENGLVKAAWKHTRMIKFVDVDQCEGKPECQAALADDWNWRLYRQLP